jgi:hypothetical protein
MAESKTRRMLFLTNADGRVVAAAPISGKSKSGVNATFAPLAGQQIHEVAVPVEIAKLHGGDFHRAVSELRIVPGSDMRLFRNLKVKRVPH